MQVSSQIDDDDDWDDEEDYDLLHRCEMLVFTVEIGELHERDKFTWSEPTQVSKKKNSCYGLRVKELDFEFKMNHIKQVIRFEIAGQFTQLNLGRTGGAPLPPVLRSLCKKIKF